MKFTFEMTVDDVKTPVVDVKTSVVKKDTCPMSGKFTFDDTDVEAKMTFTAAFSKVFSDMFGDVGDIVTFAVVENATKDIVGEVAEQSKED